jgi:carboxypeptidase family protein/TonB-dependent receptor-like protein
MAKGRSVCGRVLIYLSMAFLVASISATQLWAQAQTATISGTATDASGAAMVGAKIEAINTETNASHSTVSDAQGRYTLSDLPVATYNVQASQSGFRTVIHTGVTLSVGGAVVVDFSMPVGEVKETVSVESQVSRVETTSSEVSTLVSPTQMRELPLNGRNFEQLLTLAPGVSTIPPALNFVTGRLYGMMDNYSVSGMRPTGQMFLLDGTDIRDFWEHGTGSGYAGTSLGVEAIAEFQVLTNGYTAQYGGNGAVVNSVSRSGTNDLHGGAYEFIRNSAFDARDIADVFGGRSSPPPFKRNQFGVALGGPLKKDKVFLFGNYEGLREGLESTISGAILEPYVAAGYLPCANITPTPATCTPSTSTNSTQPGVLIGQVPSFNAAIPQANSTLALMQQVASVYSLCKGCRQIASFAGPAGFDQGGYYAVSTSPNLISNEDYALGRVDFDISPTDTMFARYVLDDARIADNPRDPTGIFPEQDFTRNQFVTISENHILSSTTVNSIRFGYVRNNENSRVQTALTSAQIAKASAFSTSVGGASFTTDPLDFVRTLYGEPQREDGSISPFFLGGIFGLGPDPNRPDGIIQSKFSGGDDLSFTRGSHNVKIGGVVTRVDTNNEQLAYADGADYYLIFSMQAFLQGRPAQDWAVPPGFLSSTRYFREIDVAPYIQDDWKVTRHLTLNLGIRYDFDTNPVGWASGNQKMTSIATFGPPGGILGTAPNCTGLTFVQSAQCALGIFTPIKHVFLNNPNAANWGPRVGFAYTPFGGTKTAIRGGFGLFHDPVTARTYESGLIATPPAGDYNLTGLPFIPGFNNGPCIPDSFASIPNYCAPALPKPAEFAGVDYIMPNGSPYDMQYNLEIQREVANGTILTVGYVGSLGRHLFMQRDINIPKCDTYPDCTALPSVKNPNSGVSFNNWLAGTTTRINPNLGYMVTELNNISSSYSSLQVSLNRQFARNLAGQVNYTWSHCIDDGSFTSSLEEFGALLVDSYNPRNDYGNCNFDVRQNLSVNGLYQLPFKGNRLVEGWQLSTILGIHSGLPIDIRNNAFAPGGEPTNLGTQAATRPNYTFAAGCSPNHVVDKWIAPGVIQWFDQSCYAPQAVGYLGNVGRNTVAGPGGIGLDFSIKKETKLTEKLNMEFRAEFFNIINHLNLNSAGVIGSLDSVVPIATGQVNSSSGTPRQIQFAVKFDF